MSVKPYLAVCAIAKNEGRYIYEWLSFNHFIGVERFVVYNNNSTDNTVDEIRRWPYADRVTVVDWPQVPGQIAAYNHMIMNFRDLAEWCAFIDCDEFLCPRSALSVPDVLRSLSPLCSGVFIHWLMYGSSGQQNFEPKPVTQRFITRGYNDFGPNNVGKTIVKLAAAIGAAGPHIIRCNGRLINDANDLVSQDCNGIHHASSHRYLALNHYYTKSQQEWIWRRSMGKADKTSVDADFFRDTQDFQLHDVNNVIDTTAADIMRTVQEKYY